MSTTTTTRKIRFAPLPDPRRSVLLVSEGVEVPFDEEVPAIPASLSIALVLSSSSPSTSKQATTTPATPTFTGDTPLTPTIKYTPSTPPASPMMPSTSKLSSNLASSVPSTSTSPLTRIMTPSQGSKSKSRSGTWPKTLLKPFLPNSSAKRHRNHSPESPSSYESSAWTSSSTGSSPNLTPTQSRERSYSNNSKDSDYSGNSNGWGSTLSRWTSGGSFTHGGDSKGPGKGYGFGTPLYRTQSTQSYKSKSSLKSGTAYASGLLSSLHQTPQAGKRERLMVNGRVYGRRGSEAVNPFANAKDDPNPEFVEWGYGGMGSVKHQKDGVGGKVWGKLASGDGEDIDDGSGMGWVRKRREEREREKKEKEEKEKKEKEEREAAAATSEKEEKMETASSTPVEEEETTTTATPQLPTITEQKTPSPTRQNTAGSFSTPPSSRPSTAQSPSETTPVSPPSSVLSATERAPTPRQSSVWGASEEHVMKTVNVPAHHHHHHKRKASTMSGLRNEMVEADVDASSPMPVPADGSSTTGKEVCEEPESVINSASVTPQVEEDEKKASIVDLSEASTPSSSSASSTTSESDEDEGEGDDEGEDDDDEEEEDEEEQERRKTSLGAGVEKISRHK